MQRLDRKAGLLYLQMSGLTIREEAAMQMATGLGPLDDYGGPTPTLPLLAGSPAVDAGNPANHPPNGHTVQLLTSSNLLDWSAVSTNTIGPSNLEEFRVPFSSETPKQHYRTVAH